MDIIHVLHYNQNQIYNNIDSKMGFQLMTWVVNVTQGIHDLNICNDILSTNEI